MSKLINEQDKEVFDIVAKVGEELRSNVFKTAAFKPLEWYEERLNRVTGAFVNLSTRFSELHAARRNNEISAYLQYKNDQIAAGEKFVSAIGEREAHKVVSDLYEAEKVFEGYIEAANQVILTFKKNMEVQMLELQREARAS